MTQVYRPDLTLNRIGYASFLFLFSPKVPNTTIAEFANTVDPDETAHSIATELLIGVYEMNLDLSRDYLRTKFF